MAFTDEEVRKVYAALWSQARQDSDRGTRSIRTDNPGNLAAQTARTVGIQVSGSQRSGLLGALKDRWHVQVNGYKRAGYTTIILSVDPHATTEAPRQPTSVQPQAHRSNLHHVTAHGFLWAKRGKGAKHKGGRNGCIVADPAKMLRGKYPNKDQAAIEHAISGMVSAGLAAWRSPEGDGNEQVLILFAPHVPHRAAMAAKAEAEAKAKAEAEAKAKAAKERTMNQQVTKIGVYMTTREAEIWSDLVHLWEFRDSLGSEPTCAPERRPEDDEAIGRMCAAGLLRPIATDTYVLAINPDTVAVKTMRYRRMIMIPKDRDREVATVRDIAQRMQDEHGRIPANAFWQAVQAETGIAPRDAMNLFLDYHDPEEGRSGRSLRILFREGPYNPHVYLAPPSLWGCNFFPAAARRQRSKVIEPRDPQYNRFRAELLAEYRQAAAFTGQQARSSCQNEEPAAPPATSRSGSAVPATPPAPAAAPPTVKQPGAEPPLIHPQLMPDRRRT